MSWASQRLGHLFPVAVGGLGILLQDLVEDFLSALGMKGRLARQELVQRVMKARTRLSSLELALQDMQVSVDGDVATVRVQGSALGAIRGEQGQFLEIHTIEVMLEEVADTWLISGARHLRDERQHASVATPD